MAGTEPGSASHGGHRRRTTSRRLAVDILYQADITATPPHDVADSWRSSGREVPTYTEHLVDGVEGAQGRIDDLLGEHSEGWPVSRMSVVDRAILRTAVYELIDGVPAAIAINEAVEAAERLSTEASGRFVNGVLGAIARALAEGAPAS